MKSGFLRCVSVMLALVMVGNLAINAQAAPSRNKGTVKYLSEVAIIEANDAQEADELLEELKQVDNGGFEGRLDVDLNVGGKKIYLAYKTSTNVDDAITDLAVMNMNGDFTIGNYEKLLSDTMSRYIEIARDYRVMAAEFKRNYDAGDRNAKTAYRQLNYYYVEENNTKIYMGDYLLNFPLQDEGFAEILFRGNLNIIANMRTLLAMAAGEKGTSFAQRIEDSYKEALTDAAVYDNAAYEEVAKALKKEILEMKDVLNTLPQEIEKIESSTLDQEDKDGLLLLNEQTLDINNAFLELLKQIPLAGEDTTLGDYVMATPIIDTQKLYPVVAAATEAEKLLMEYYSFNELLLYDELSLGEEAMDEALAELEKDYEPLSVYYGVQNEMMTGSVGVTGDAEFLASTTGRNPVSEGQSSVVQALKITGFTLLGAGGLASAIGGAAFLGIKHSAALTAKETLQASLQQALTQAQTSVSFQTNLLVGNMDLYTKMVERWGEEAATKTLGNTIIKNSQSVATAHKELETATANLANANQTATLTGGQIALGSVMITLGVVMMGISIWQLVEIHNQYEVTYTDIPDNMVHVVSNDTYGDRFINYKNVPAYYYKDGKLARRENDMNAYKGNQWVSLYYTKNYEAGYCLTSTPDLIATEAARTGYSAIHLFGHSSNYNLNSYCNRKDAADVYLAFKYSTNQKSAAADVPAVIGTAFSAGILAVTGFGGFAVGMVLMAVIKRKKPVKTVKEVKAEA